MVHHITMNGFIRWQGVQMWSGSIGHHSIAFKTQMELSCFLLWYTCQNVKIISCDLFQSNKPIVEKRRRERINRSLEELKKLVLQSLHKDVSTAVVFVHAVNRALWVPTANVPHCREQGRFATLTFERRWAKSHFEARKDMWLNKTVCLHLVGYLEDGTRSVYLLTLFFGSEVACSLSMLALIDIRRSDKERRQPFSRSLSLFFLAKVTGKFQGGSNREQTPPCIYTGKLYSKDSGKQIT